MIPTTKRLIVKRHEFVCDGVYSSFFPTESFEEAFGSTKEAAAIDVANAHREAINWSWLRWHLDHGWPTIQRELIADVRRACNAIASGGLNDNIVQRGFHDRMLMHVAILSGDKDTMKAAAAHIRPASTRTHGYQYDAAIAGLLASRIGLDGQAEAAQLRIAEAQPPTGANPVPSKNLARAFVARQYDAFARELKTSVAVYSDINRLRGKASRPTLKPVIVGETEKEIVLDVFKKDPHFMWPYVEATFAKLAIMDGAAIAIDCFWFPLEFVKGR